MNAEVISIVSGKGGAGKTIVASSLGYALINAGHRVLMVDGDRGTQGLSLFLLGPNGHERIKDIDEQDTLISQLKKFAGTKSQPRKIKYSVLNRSDHGGVRYNTVVSDRSAYGDEPYLSTNQFTTEDYCLGMRKFVEAARKSSEFDYVIVDTRGGFSSESTRVAAMSDSIIVVTEPDYTSFFQIKNLLREISNAAGELNRAPVVRGVLVNRATAVSNFSVSGDTSQIDLEQIESNYRLSISDNSGEYPIDYRMTHPLPSDIAVVDCYRTQKIPLQDAIGSPFSFAIYTAFTEIMRVVTAKWSSEQVSAWSNLSERMDEENKKSRQERERAEASEKARVQALRDEADRARVLERELEALRENTRTLERVAFEKEGGSQNEMLELFQQMQMRQREESREHQYHLEKLLSQQEKRPSDSVIPLASAFFAAILVGIFFYFFGNTTTSSNTDIIRILEIQLAEQQARYEAQLSDMQNTLDELSQRVQNQP